MKELIDTAASKKAPGRKSETGLKGRAYSKAQPSPAFDIQRFLISESVGTVAGHSWIVMCFTPFRLQQEILITGMRLDQLGHSES